MSAQKSYSGGCFCGAVEVRVSGDPVAMGYCHCKDCRDWSAAPVNAFTLWKPENVEVTRGADSLASFNRTDNSTRKWCKRCGGHVMTGHPHAGIVDVYAATIPGLAFKPALHVHYREAVMKMKDGLPKLKDTPKDLGGSGDTLPE
jgi:hypothetical protein